MIPKISVTGTKGKTTVVNVIASVLERLDRDVLKVDTTGHYVNGEQRSTLEDSKRIWNLVPSVCPGRYLSEFLTDERLAASKHPVAVLECALGSSASAGLGYREHEVGVFLNVMEDHLGSSERLKTQADIAQAKSFVFRRVKQDGYAVFNADDSYVTGKLDVVPAEREAVLIPCGLEFAHFDVKKHLTAGGVALTMRGSMATLLSGEDEVELFDLKALPWTFEATFLPSVYNLLHAAGALYGFYGGKLPQDFRSVMEATRLDPYGGRLTLLEAANGTKILADYAHEKVSLSQVGDLARRLTAEGGWVIGVVRLAYDRTPALIQETGRAIASHFDEFVVYDKVDGYWAKGVERKGRRFQKVEGRVSQLLADAISAVNPRVTRIVREDEAVTYAAKNAGPADVVVVIVNDDIKRSLGFIQQAFAARFL